VKRTQEASAERLAAAQELRALQEERAILHDELKSHTPGFFSTQPTGEAAELLSRLRKAVKDRLNQVNAAIAARILELCPLDPQETPMLREYRKKPVIVHAIQFTGDNGHAVIGELALAGCERVITYNYTLPLARSTLTIHTLEGDMTASPGDYILGVQGEPYPCKPDIFAATYEAAEPAGRRFT